MIRIPGRRWCRFVLRPDLTRLAPSPPFDAEVASRQRLVYDLVDRLHLN